MKFQKVFQGIVFVFMIVVVVLLFQIQSTVDHIKKSTVDNNKFDNIELTVRDIKPTVDFIRQLCLGIPLLMR
jgi:hypothetical protein